MSVKNSSGRFMLALVAGSVLSACSPSASTAVPPVDESIAAAALLPVAAQAVVATPPAATAPVQPLVTGLPDFTALVERYGPAVVNVRVEERRQARAAQQRPPSSQDELLRRFFGPEFQMPVPEQRQQPRRGEGSGFIVSPDGYVMTNAHVVEGATDVVVTLSDRREFEAKVVGTDQRTDVAVLKVEGESLPTVKIGDPSKLKPGQWVVAIGSPFGMQNSVTAGIVSATSRDLPYDGDQAPPPFIQTDAAVNPGNSGGPLFNLQGEVIGINSQIYSPSGGYVGLSFAIPIDIADNVRGQLVKTGKVTRSMIGVRIRGVTAADAEGFRLDRPRGALVVEVTPDSPAEKAGLEVGDVVLAVDGRPIESSSYLPTIVSSMAPGTATDLEVWRNGAARKHTVKVVEIPSAQVQPASLEQGSQQQQRREQPPAVETTSLGFSVRVLTADERKQLDTQGYLVVERAEGAAAGKLQPGDIIIGVAGAPVKSVAELEAKVKAAPRAVPLRIQREGNSDFVTLRKQ